MTEPDLSPHIALFRLGLRIQHVSQKLEETTALSLSQWAALKCLVDLPLATAGALAESLGIHASTLTQVLKRLERRGLILVSADPQDARRKLISVTRKGFEGLRKADAALHAWQTSHAPLSLDAARELCRNLEALLQPLSPMGDRT